MQMTQDRLWPRAGALCGLLLAITFFTGCGDDNTPQETAPGEPGAAGVLISIEPGAMSRGSNAFGENPRRIPLGTTVTWTNNDSVPHTTTSTTGIWDSESLAPGASFSRVFNATGTFPYFCELHPGMRGTIEVSEDESTGTAPSPTPTSTSVPTHPPMQ